MKIYHLTQPLLKNSVDKIYIFNEKNEKVGHLKRFFNGKSRFLIDLIFGEFFVHLNIYNANDELIYEINEKLNLNIKELFRSKWLLNKISSDEIYSGIILEKSLIKTNPRFILKHNNRSITLTGDIGDKTSRIYDEENNLISTIERTSLVPKKVKISIKEDNDLDYLLIIGFYYLFDLKR